MIVKMGSWRDGSWRWEGEGFKFYMYDLNVVIFEACSQLLNSM